MKRLIMAAIVLLPFKAQAVDSYLILGYGDGGSNLSSMTGGQNYNVRGGGGILFGGGIIVPVTDTLPHHFENQFGISYLNDLDRTEKSHEVTWRRYPLDALYFYRNTQQDFRLGWGLTYHVGNKIEGKGHNDQVNAHAREALGWVLAGEKLWWSDFYHFYWTAGFRYTFIKYNSTSFSREVDGNGWMLTVGISDFYVKRQEPTH